MRKSALFLTGIFGILLVLGLVLTGCPTDTDDPDNTPTVSAVTVSPATFVVSAGGTQQFTVAVTGTNSPATTVTWSVTGGGTGTSINETGGLLTVAAGETAETLTVKATSTVDTTKSGTATGYVTPDPTAVTVTVSPATPGVGKGGTQQFTATVTNSSSQTVTWSVTGNNDAGTAINTSGLLTVAAGETAVTLTVKATFTVDTTKSGTATVTVYGSQGEVPAVSTVTVSPVTPNVVTGGTQQFTATVAGTNNPPQGVTWSVTGGGTGTAITTGGILVVAAGETAETLTVKATSKVDSTKYGTATVTVTRPTVTSVSINPATVSVVKGGTPQQFTATVTGTNNPATTVTWSVTGNTNSGTAINTSGLLTVAAGETATTLVVRATSTVDTTKYGTATVAVTSSSSNSPGTSTWWRGRYAYGSDYVDLTTGSVRMDGETTTIPNITTEAGGNVMYGGADIGDWLYVCSGGTPFGIVVNVEQGQSGVYGGFNDEGVDALVDTITGYGPSFSPRPSVQHMSGYGWLWSPKQ